MDTIYGDITTNYVNMLKEYNQKNKIYFSKIKENAIIPTKRNEDGCYDLYANFDEDEITIQPHEIKIISTGIASACSPKYRFAFRERGSNTKSRLIVVAGQIDSGWRGEWFVSLYNSQHIPIRISKLTEDYEYYITSDTYGEYIRIPYKKAICQFAIEEVPVIEQIEIPYDELKNIKSERMFGCLGDSGK